MDRTEFETPRAEKKEPNKPLQDYYLKATKRMEDNLNTDFDVLGRRE